MSDKYIIRNCPNFDDYFNPNETCQKRYSQYCQDCTDCKLKQIVELCKYYKKHSDCGRECPSFGMFLSKLLGKLDIEEIE